ncbi:MAG: CHASE2 domain-containing protein [Candidatus Omnitrophota bacterium]
MMRIKRLFKSKANKRRPKTKPRVFGIYWALGLSVLIFVLSLSSFAETFERKIFDSAMRLRGERKINPAIEVVEIDDTSIDNFGRWPWPRGYHASFLQILSEYNPKVIGYDVLFSESDIEHPEDDIALARKTQDLDSVIFPGYFVISKDEASQIKQPKKIPPEMQEKLSLDYRIKPKDKFLKSIDAYCPIPLLAKSCSGIGHVNVPADPDGVVRRIPLVLEFEGRLYPSFDLVIIAQYLGISIKDIKVKPSFVILTKDSKVLVKIPIDKRGWMLINYAGKFENLPRKSFSQVILAYDQIKNYEAPIINLSDFNDKIILVGLSATGTSDTRATPFSEIFPGAGIHANVINNILDRDFIVRANRFIFAFVILFLALGIGIMIPRFHPLMSFLITIAIVIVYVLGCFLLFALKGIWIGILAPVLVMATTYVVVVLNQFVVSRFENQLIKKELTIASQIQQSMLPQDYPKVEDLDFYCQNKPAKFVGGDLYDFFLIDKDTLAIAIGDVSGKGVPAALFMAKIITHLRSAIGLHKDPAKVLSHINERLAAEGSSGLFVTLLYLVIDLNSRQLLFSNAGHHSILCINQNEDKFKLMSEEKSMPIGLMPEVEFSTEKTGFSLGDIFVLFSDGITEAINKAGVEYEIDRLKTFIQQHKNISAKELTNKIIGDVEDFAKKLVQHDDMTVITIKIK